MIDGLKTFFANIYLTTVFTSAILRETHLNLVGYLRGLGQFHSDEMPGIAKRAGPGPFTFEPSHMVQLSLFSGTCLGWPLKHCRWGETKDMHCHKRGHRVSQKWHVLICMYRCRFRNNYYDLNIKAMHLSIVWKTIPRSPAPSAVPVLMGWGGERPSSWSFIFNMDLDQTAFQVEDHFK